jgi:hypothetical protein
VDAEKDRLETAFRGNASNQQREAPDDCVIVDRRSWPNPGGQIKRLSEDTDLSEDVQNVAMRKAFVRCWERDTFLSSSDEDLVKYPSADP